MEWLKDLLTGAGGVAIASVIVMFIASWVKKGQFENWGITIGSALSKLGNAKLGKAVWEKLEDSITVAFVTFAQGIKKGADLDDNGQPNPKTKEDKKGK